MAQAKQIKIEMDLIEVLKCLWNGKWIICGMSAITLAVSGFYVVLMPNRFETSIILRELDTTTMSEYQLLTALLYNADQNRWPSVSPQHGNFVDSRIATSAITSSSSFLSEFIDVLSQRDVIARAAASAEIPIQQNPGHERLNTEHFEDFALALEISTTEIPAPTPSGTSIAWRLSWQSNDQEFSNKFIPKIIEMTNEETRLRLLQRLNSTIGQLQNIQMQRADQLRKDIENAIENYQVQLNDELARLEEQASLARILGVETAPVSRIENLNSLSDLSGTRSTVNMTYLNGYRVLDEQMRILRNRNQVEAFIPSLRELQNQLKEIEQDNTSNLISTAVDMTSLALRGSFEAVRYDPASLRMTYLRDNSFVLTLAVLFGACLGAALVLIQHVTYRIK